MARSTDANQAEIVAALREIGATVHDTHGVGKGYPDISVGFRGRTYLLEIKTAKGRLRREQQEFFEGWRGHVAVVRSIDDAYQVIGATTAESVVGGKR